MKVSYSSPVILTFVFLSFFELCLGYATGGATKAYFTSSSWSGSVLYIFGHSDMDHFVSNMAFILLLGPLLEDRYGSYVLFVMIAATTIFTTLINPWIFDEKIMGASGIVFMMIVLSSMTTMKNGTISLTFILVVLLYVGKEIVASFTPDNISHFAHIVGGFSGGMLGGIFAPIRRDQLP